MADEINHYTVFGCPDCYSVLRRNGWYNVGEDVYREVKQVTELMETNCPACYDGQVQSDLDRIFDELENGSKLEKVVTE